MHQSLNFDSIPDDALFESGTGSWNQNLQQGTSAIPIQQSTLSDRTNIMALHNDDDVRNISSTGNHQRRNTDCQENQRRQPLARSQTPPESLLAVFDVMSDPAQPELATQDVEHGGARAKTYRNKENRNKNIAKKKNGFVASNEENARNQHQKCKETTTGWEPSLQFKRYSDDEDLIGSENTCRKVVNQSKQRKQNINKNMMKSQNELAPDPNARSSDSLLNVACIPSPAGLDPMSNPRNISNIYVKNVNNPAPIADNDLETDFYSVHHNEDSNKIGKSNKRLYEGSNVTQIHNNLWDGQIKDKNGGDASIGQMKLEHEGKNTIPVVRNLPDEKNTTVIKFAHPANLHRAVSDSGLNTSIVVPYQSNGSTDNLMQYNSTTASVGSSPSSLVSSFNVSPNAPLTNSVVNEPAFNFSDSLPSNLSSNVLFGDGISNDYIIAQQLQQQFDREHKEMQRLQQYDIVPEESTYIGPDDTTYRVSESNGYNFTDPTTENQTLDYITANEYQTLNDSLTNETSPVYDTRNEDRQSAGRNTIYIPCDNQVETHADDQAENESETLENNTEDVDRDRVEVSPDETRESHQIQNDEQYPNICRPQEPIYIPYREDEGRIAQPEPSLPSNSLVARGSGTRQQSRGSVARQQSEQLDDAELARRLQEQQDEEYARRLQEEEREEEEHLHGNHGNRVNIRNIEHNNTYRNHQPLHSRFGHTWTNRPLRVAPPLGAVSNNVADSRVRSRNTWDRPLQQRSDNEFGYLDTVHSLSVNEGYDIPPSQDYYYRYQNDPDLMLDDNGEDRLVSINRDPQLLATLLMTRAPHMMIPNHIDLNDYEALWELAENLGEVRRVGMDENDISLLPIHTYKQSTSSTGDDNKTDCLVCLSEFVDGDQLRTLPCCHIYHVECIDEWLRRNAVCPVCRQSAANRD